VDWVAVLAFDAQIAGISAADFVQSLRQCLPFAELWVGPDFALGRGREGSLTRLQELGQAEGFAVRPVSPLVVEGQPVNSTRIRQLLAAGEVRAASALLGRPAALSGPVVPGVQRGRQLGFPTANLQVDEQLLVPANGVYAVYARWGERRQRALVNIGNRPTFDNGPRSIEAYLLDVAEDLYGQEITLEFGERLRGEMRFPSPEALVAQINEDVRRARDILK
jgi:riboflavin kinase/FMN adenylyltransferase